MMAGTSLPVLCIEKKTMLDDSQAQKWSGLANSDGSIAWPHDIKFVYLAQPTKLVRISLPVGKMERVLDLRNITLG
jgi:hypothetical protein